MAQRIWFPRSRVGTAPDALRPDIVTPSVRRNVSHAERGNEETSMWRSHAERGNEKHTPDRSIPCPARATASTTTLILTS